MMSRLNSRSKDMGRPRAAATGGSHIPDLQYTAPLLATQDDADSPPLGG